MNTQDKIAVCSRSFSNNSVLCEELQSRYQHVTLNTSGKSLVGDELISFLRGHNGAIIALEVIDSEILDKLPELEFIGKYGVGLDKLDFDAMEAHDVKLGWTPGVNARNVAELTLGLAINLVKFVPESVRMATEYNWKQVIGNELSSMTYGILGCGHVGKALVQLLKGFGANIIINDILEMNDFCQQNNIEQVSFDDLFKQSDIVSIHVPRNHTTENIVDGDVINSMKDGAFLINTARGGIVDESAVLDALNSGKLSGIAFDVLKEEPPTNNPLIGHPQAIITTHIAGSSKEAILAMGRAAIDGLSNYYPANTFSQFK